jgi:hypothetical protein
MSQGETYDALKAFGPCTAKALGQKMNVGPSGIGSCLRRLENWGDAKRLEIKNPHGRGGRSVIWEAI